MHVPPRWSRQNVSDPKPIRPGDEALVLSGSTLAEQRRDPQCDDEECETWTLVESSGPHNGHTTLQKGKQVRGTLKCEVKGQVFDRGMSPQPPGIKQFVTYSSRNWVPRSLIDHQPGSMFDTKRLHGMSFQISECVSCRNPQLRLRNLNSSISLPA